MTPSKQFVNPFLETPRDSRLDPADKNFNARLWLENLVGFATQQSADGASFQPRHAGVAFRNMNVYGFGSSTDYQKTVLNVWFGVADAFRWILGSRQKQRIQILKDFNGLVEPGEMLLVLGRPGSGCSTLLKTISGDIHGLEVDQKSYVNYHGIPAQQMQSQFRGEAIYVDEHDAHFPQMTVGQTLLFAARARAPRDGFLPGVSQELYARHMRDVLMATFGLNHTKNTYLGNHMIAGVSGGEKKRVSIAEAALSGCPLQCWDNSTRGLDSENALQFCKTVKLSTDFAGATALVSLYQGSQDAYETFNKVTVLYEGRQIYFGPCSEAKSFFTRMGFDCAPRQTTPDFLTALTSPRERLIRPGFEDRTPRTVDEFEGLWHQSPEYGRLMASLDSYNQRFPIGGKSVDAFMASRKAQQAFGQRNKSPYTISIYQQVKICVVRGFQRLRGDATVTISRGAGNSALAVIIGSMFYNLQPTTASLYSRSVLIFLSILLNAFASALEILILYDQRPIVEKHARYALYHPAAEAVASALCDMPFKIINSICFNLILYFMTNLRREPGPFFVFLLISFTITVSLSMVFRTVGAASRSLSGSLPYSSVLILALMTYTGFVVPIGDMHPWFRWIGYIDPIAYAFEALMINEYQGREFACSSFIPEGPAYVNLGGINHICGVVGAVPGSDVVSGTDYIRLSFNYEPSHLWRNFGVIIVLTILFTVTYLIASEIVTAKKSKGEVLLFQRGHQRKLDGDIEKPKKLASLDSVSDHSSKDMKSLIQKQTSVFHWRDICYDIKIKKEDRRILDHVDGWVKPGTLTVLMGPSGAGKTTLLDVLATRDTSGIASGEAFVDGHERDISFQRKTGYAQQHDTHLETMTVREALRFNAVMCQPATISKEDKYAYVERVIELLGMECYAEAIVGLPGEGLNIEQRKKVTIAVEVASRPELLLFLDEPSSGLDSQTSWAILDLLENLTAHGQAILCTIHQPSAMLFQRFDRLLFLAPEGKPVYFGEIGQASTTVVQYFEKNGAKKLSDGENPAEWLMKTIGCTPGSYSEIDWPTVWRNSPEFAAVHRELDRLESNGQAECRSKIDTDLSKVGHQEFAAPFGTQLWECLKRVNQQYWRTPSYIYSKLAICFASALFLGFTFYQEDNSLQGLQNQVFAIFMLITQSANLVPQILPHFVIQRDVYEARERPAKTYSWQVFMLSNILVELPWNMLMSVFLYVGWYYPIGFYRNAEPTHTVAERGVTMWLLMLAYMMFTSTFGHMMQAGVQLAEMGGNYANLLFMMSLIFCGVLISPDTLPGFWIFMYRLSPYTYLVSAVLSVGLANAPASCSSIEYLHFDPLPGIQCASYMESYIKMAGGYLVNPEATSDCSFCPIANTNAFLEYVHSEYDQRWRDFGILWVYIVFNAAAALALYWLARVPKKSKKTQMRQGEIAATSDQETESTSTMKVREM